MGVVHHMCWLPKNSVIHSLKSFHLQLYKQFHSRTEMRVQANIEHSQVIMEAKARLVAQCATLRYELAWLVSERFRLITERQQLLKEEFTHERTCPKRAAAA